MKRFLKYTLIVSLFVLCVLALTVLGASAATPPAGAATDDGTAVAKITVSSTDYFYTDLSAAVQDAVDNDATTVTVLKNVAVNSTIAVNKNITIVGSAGTETVTNASGGYLFAATAGTLTVKNLTVATAGSFVDISGTASLVIGAAGGNNAAPDTVIGGNASTNALIKVTAALTGDITVHPGARLYYNDGDFTGSELHMIHVPSQMTGNLTINGKIDVGSEGNYLIGSGSNATAGTDIICINSASGAVDVSIGGVITAYMQAASNRTNLTRFINGVHSLNITGEIHYIVGPGLGSSSYTSLLYTNVTISGGVTISNAVLDYTALHANSNIYSTVIYIGGGATTFTINDSTIAVYSTTATMPAIYGDANATATVHCTDTVITNQTTGALFANATPTNYVRFTSLATALTSNYTVFSVEDSGYYYVYPTLAAAISGSTASQTITVLKNYAMGDDEKIAPSRNITIAGRTSAITITTPNSGTSTKNRFYENSGSGTYTLTLSDLTLVGTNNNMFLTRSSAATTYNFDNVTINAATSAFYFDGTSHSTVTFTDCDITVAANHLFSVGGSAVVDAVTVENSTITLAGSGNMFNQAGTNPVTTATVEGSEITITNGYMFNLASGASIASLAVEDSEITITSGYMIYLANGTSSVTALTMTDVTLTGALLNRYAGSTGTFGTSGTPAQLNNVTVTKPNNGDGMFIRYYGTGATYIDFNGGSYDMRKDGTDAGGSCSFLYGCDSNAGTVQLRFNNAGATSTTVTTSSSGGSLSAYSSTIHFGTGASTVTIIANNTTFTQTRGGGYTLAYKGSGTFTGTFTDCTFNNPAAAPVLYLVSGKSATFTDCDVDNSVGDYATMTYTTDGHDAKAITNGTTLRLGSGAGSTYSNLLALLVDAIPANGSGTITVLAPIIITTANTIVQNKAVTLVGQGTNAVDLTFSPSASSGNLLFKLQTTSANVGASVTFVDMRVNITAGGLVGFYNADGTSGTMDATLTNSHVTGTVTCYLFGTTSHSNGGAANKKISATNVTIDADSSVTLNLSGTGGSGSLGNDGGYIIFYYRWACAANFNATVNGSLDVTVGASARAFMLGMGSNYSYFNLVFGDSATLNLDIDENLATTIAEANRPFLSFIKSGDVNSTITMPAAIATEIVTANFYTLFPGKAPNAVTIHGQVADSTALAFGAKLKLDSGTIYSASLQTIVNAIPANGSGTITVLASLDTSAGVTVTSKTVIVTSLGERKTITFDQTADYLFIAGDDANLTFTNISIIGKYGHAVKFMGSEGHPSTTTFGDGAWIHGNTPGGSTCSLIQVPSGTFYADIIFDTGSIVGWDAFTNTRSNNNLQMFFIYGTLIGNVTVRGELYTEMSSNYSGGKQAFIQINGMTGNFTVEEGAVLRASAPGYTGSSVIEIDGAINGNLIVHGNPVAWITNNATNFAPFIINNTNFLAQFDSDANAEAAIGSNYLKLGNDKYALSFPSAVAAIPSGGSGTITVVGSITITTTTTQSFSQTGNTGKTTRGGSTYAHAVILNKTVTIVGDGDDLTTDITFTPSSSVAYASLFTVRQQGTLILEDLNINLTKGQLAGFDSMDGATATTGNVVISLVNTKVTGSPSAYLVGNSASSHSVGSAAFAATVADPLSKCASVDFNVDADSVIDLTFSGEGGAPENHGFVLFYHRWVAANRFTATINGTLRATVPEEAKAFQLGMQANMSNFNIDLSNAQEFTLTVPAAVQAKDYTYAMCYSSSNGTTLTLTPSIYLYLQSIFTNGLFQTTHANNKCVFAGYATDEQAVAVGYIVRLGDTASGNLGTVYFNTIASAIDAVPASGSGTIHVLAPVTVTATTEEHFVNGTRNSWLYPHTVIQGKTITVVGDNDDATTDITFSPTVNYAYAALFELRHDGTLILQNLNIALTKGQLAGYDNCNYTESNGGVGDIVINLVNTKVTGSPSAYLVGNGGSSHSPGHSSLTGNPTKGNKSVSFNVDADSVIDLTFSGTGGTDTNSFYGFLLFYHRWVATNKFTATINGTLRATVPETANAFRLALQSNNSNFNVDLSNAVEVTLTVPAAVKSKSYTYAMDFMDTSGGTLTVSSTVYTHLIEVFTNGLIKAGSNVRLVGAGYIATDAQAIELGCYFRLGDVEGSGYYSSLTDLIADLEANEISGEVVTRHLQTAYLLQNYTTNATFYITAKSLRITSVGNERLTITLNAFIPVDLISGSQLILGNVEVVATQRFMRFRYNDTAAKNIFTMENGALLRATGGDGNFIYVNLSDGPDTPGVIEVNLNAGSTIRREAIGSSSALLFNLDNSAIGEDSTITVAGTIQNNCGALGGKNFSMFRCASAGVALHIASTARLSTTATGGPTNSSYGAMIAMAGAVTVDAGGTAQDPQFKSEGTGVVSVFALQWGTNAYTINGTPTFDLGTAPAGNFSAYMVNRQSDAMSVRVTTEWVAINVFGATIRVGAAPTGGDYAYMYHDYFSGFNSLCAAVTHTENSTVLSNNDTIYIFTTQNITSGCTLLSDCTSLQLSYPTDAPAFNITSGTVVLYGLAINQCNTFAEISGTGRLDFNRGTTLTATASTANALHGTAMIELSGGGRFYMNYHSAGAPSMTFTGATTLDTPYTVFHTSADWNGVISIGGTISYGWSTTGNSSIFKADGTGTSGIILVNAHANVQHNGTVGNGATATMVRSAAAEGSGVQIRVLNPTTFGTYFKIHDITAQDANAAYQLRIGHVTPRHQYTASIFDYPWDVICVNVTWGDLGYTYTPGAWNADTHTYAAGVWTVNQTNGDKITVENAGDVVVRVSIAFTPANGYSAFGGTFTEGGNPVGGSVLLTSPNIKESEASKVFTFAISCTGTPANMQSQAVGSITVTISANDRNVTTEMQYTNRYGGSGYNLGDGNGTWVLPSSNGGVYRGNGVFYQAYYGGDNMRGVIQRYDKNTQQTVYSKIFLHESINVTGANYVNVSMGHLNGITYNSHLNKVVVAPGSGSNDDGTSWGGRYVLLLDGDTLEYNGKVDTDSSFSGIAFVPQATIRGETYNNIYVCLAGSIYFYDENFQRLKDSNQEVIPGFTTGMDSYAEVGQCIGADADHVYFLCNTYSYPFTQDTIVRVYDYDGNLVDYIRMPIDNVGTGSGTIHAENVTPIGDYLYIMGSGNPTMVVYKIAKEYDK